MTDTKETNESTEAPAELDAPDALDAPEAVEEQAPEATEEETEAKVVDPRAVADLMLALDQVFKIGVFYPPGHPLCDQAADYFLRALIRVVGKTPVLRFDIGEDLLVVQGVELDHELSGVSRFQELLDQLGIVRLDIDAAVNAEELYDFVKRLIAFRSQIQSTVNFQQVIVDHMPPTVRVHHREFVARRTEHTEADGSVRDLSLPSVDTLLATLSNKGLDAEQISFCRRLLESLPDDLEGRTTLDGSLPQVSWSDVEKLLLRVVKQDPDTLGKEPGARPETNMSLDALATIFRSLGEDAAPERHRDAIDLLLSLNQRAKQFAEDDDDEKPAASSKPAARPEDDRTAPDAAAIKESLVAYSVGAKDISSLLTDDRCEDLSILMQLLRRDQKLQAQVRIERLLRDILSTPLEPAEWRIVVEGIRYLLELRESERVAGAVVMVTGALRRSSAGSPLAFLRDVSLGCSNDQLAAVWPFLVNEILLSGRLADPEVFANVCEIASSLQADIMRMVLPELEHLEALREKRLAVDVFAPPPRSLFPVFAMLLETTSASLIGKRLVVGLRHDPPGWIGEAVVPLIDQYSGRYRGFLIELMRAENLDRPLPALSKQAARIVADALPSLPRKVRNEKWVPTTVRSLSRLPVPAAESILRSVAFGRRFLFFSNWPAACREAAGATLKKIKDRAAPIAE